MSKGFIIIIGLILIGLVCLLFYPAVHRDPPTPREGVYTGAIKTALMAYYNEYGSYPPTGNAEMARSLMGGNKRKILFLEWTPGKTNGVGDICDFWGTPYRIQSDGARPIVTSAGPDKTLDTEDDIKSE